MTWYELSPAYGRDYKTVKAVKEAFLTGMDFEGDYQLGFKLVNMPQLPEVKDCAVILRYKGMTQTTVIKSPFKAVAPGAPKNMKAPSMATVQSWIFDGVAKATDGCRVEPDGVCPHGCNSWAVEMGLI